MEKSASPNPKRADKKPKNKKNNQPLKVVYITNPIKFETTASEFRALVQELTGQDSDVCHTTSFGVGEVTPTVHARQERHVAAEVGQTDPLRKGSDLIGSYEDDDAGYYSMWHQDANLEDVFKRLA